MEESGVLGLWSPGRSCNGFVSDIEESKGQQKD